MKIITNSECYIQVYDVEHLYNTESDMDFDLYSKMLENRKENYNLNEYVRVDDLRAIEYILANNNIVSFEELHSKSIMQLKRMQIIINAAIIDDCEKTREQNNNQNNIDEHKRRLTNYEYLLKQIKDMIRYKKRSKKQVKFPDAPNPTSTIVTNGDLKATMALNLDEVVIYNADGSRVNSDIDKDFCKTAYAILMRDRLLEEERENPECLNLQSRLSDNRKYCIVGEKKIPQMDLIKKLLLKD